ncbi:hypothetical protein QFC21_003905 [Naganishia friedmannii]|uniref:Uncharacterized protein n=1 Tax=Naganishia friedmannii TaxID=89922 RepID=A0ACC2VLY1_9TREE|nr:hypothetical protein QFC21_003905 [Naganishia friedmannii]
MMGPFDLWLAEEKAQAARLAAILAPRHRRTPPVQFANINLPGILLELVAESLIARGCLASLASLNTASRQIYQATLPLLWRTFIWDSHGKGQAEEREAWDLIVGKRGVNGSRGTKPARGAKHIRRVVLILSVGTDSGCSPLISGERRFFVDRTNTISNEDKHLPPFLFRLPAFENGNLKSYVAEFDDKDQHFVKSDERKVVIHLLAGYQPVGFGRGGDEDYITLRHALLHLSPPPGDKRPSKLPKDTSTPTSVGYAFFIVHPSPALPSRPLPLSFDKYATRHPLPLLPIILDAVLLAPSTIAFEPEDKARLSRIVFELLASLDHEPRQEVVEWNGFIGGFTTQRVQEEDKCRNYIEFHWQETEESVVICAQAVSVSFLLQLLLAGLTLITCTQAAEALNPFRSSVSYNWVELLFSNHIPFSHDDTAIHKILKMLQPHYMHHAPNRLHPPSHAFGDVVVQDITRDLLAALKRVVPGGVIRSGSGRGKVKRERRNVVEYFVKRYPEGEGGWDEKTFHDSHDTRVVFYKEFPVEAPGAELVKGGGAVLL